MINQTSTSYPKQLTSQQRSDLDYVTSLTPPGVPLTYNLADDAQYRVVMWHIEDAGHTPQTSPQLYRAIADTRAEHQRSGPPTEKTLLQMDSGTTGWTDINLLVTLGDTGGTAFNSSALSSMVGGTIMTKMILNVIDLTTNQQIGSNSNQFFGQGTYQPLQASANAQSASDNIKSYYLCMYQKKQGQPIQTQGMYLTDQDAPKIPPNVTNPYQVYTHGNYIVVALNRGTGPQSGCDYWYSNAGPTNAQLLVNGNIQYNGSIITPLADQGAQANFSGNLYMVNRNGGGQKWLQGQSYVPFMTVSTTAVPNDTLTWNFGTAQFGPYSPWNSGDIVDLNLILTVQLTNNPGIPIPMTVSSTQGTTPSSDTTVIKPLQFITSCLAEGTQILLADRTCVAIERLSEPGALVLADSSGRTLRVASNIVHTRNIPLLALMTDQGHTLRLTPEHPVMTPGGVRVAKTLAVGDPVLTIDGEASISAIETQPYEGLTYNLNLEEEGNDSRAITGDHTTMFADGILVGDYRMQDEHYTALLLSKESVLERIPAEWHEDYLNSLAR